MVRIVGDEVRHEGVDPSLEPFHLAAVGDAAPDEFGDGVSGAFEGVDQEFAIRSVLPGELRQAGAEFPVRPGDLVPADFTDVHELLPDGPPTAGGERGREGFVGDLPEQKEGRTVPDGKRLDQFLDHAEKLPQLPYVGRMRCLLLFVALLGLALPSLADGFRDVKKAFQAAFAKPLPANEREQAVRQLAAFDSKDAAKLLIGALPVTRGQYDLLLVERANVQSGKIEFPDGGPQPRLSELKGPIDREMRVMEALDDALAGMREKRTVQYLFRDALSREKNRHTRVSVAKALGRIGNAAAAPALEKALTDKSEQVRGAAALSLGRLKVKAAVPALLELLESDAWPLRAAACEALGQIGDLRAVVPLIERLSREEGRLAQIHQVLQVVAALADTTFVAAAYHDALRPNLNPVTPRN